jgi:hypothetical protein
MENRVNKYKQYREQIISLDKELFEGEPESSDRARMRTTLNDSSNVLPMDAVIEKLCMDKEEIKRIKRERFKKILKPILIISGITIVLVTLVIVGIIVFQ